VLQVINLKLIIRSRMRTSMTFVYRYEDGDVLSIKF
jgi:hypothetical protein